MSHTEPDKGLPMTSKWEPARLQREIAELQELESEPMFSRVGGYMRRTGPGLLQSAMTLGAGSAVASVVAGASFGYDLLWVQPVAMFLGVFMLAALGNVVLTTGERPYGSFSRELHKSIAFLWALGTVVASVIWHFPQYGLAAGAAWDLADVCGVPQSSQVAEYAVKFGLGAAILCVGIFTTWNYGSNAKGIKAYEWFLRGMIALVIIAFGVVVVVRAVGGHIDWAAMAKGFFAFRIPEGSTIVVLGAIGAAVGINMTFLYPYSLLAKGWGKHHKTLSRWDLGMSMFLPFVIVTSLVIVAMASTIYDDSAGQVLRKDLKPVDAAQALAGVMGSTLSRIIFNLGLIGMTCAAISTHMVVCGFTVCEMFGLEYTTRRYRLCTLVPVVGVLGVVTTTPLWLPVTASAICLTMLPIAYIAFFIMNNKRSYIGAAVGSGWRRAAFNLILLVAIALATIGSAVRIKSGVIDNLPKLFPREQPNGAYFNDAGEKSRPSSIG
ncbi:MAG: divalent metal cation transporter [Pirellulaceae bacterium]|nr:divalent metal cation transporter [Pirellulaceae bacterium]